MAKINGRKLGLVGMALLDLALVPYAAALAVRNPVAPPKDYLRVPAAQVAQYDRQYVEIKGKPVSVNYEPRILSRGLDIVLQLEDGRKLNAQSGLLPASLTEARNANVISPEKAEEISKILKEGIFDGSLDSIVLKGRYIRDDGVFRIYTVNIKGEDYHLLRHIPTSL